jgi:photosystem II stability/assembly factor-like uncharacterized protein
VADPLNPNISYAGGPGGGIIKTTYPSGQWAEVSPNVDSSLALRKIGSQPLVFSTKNPHELLTGFQCVMATIDGGKSWRKISPDLTLKPGQTAPPVVPSARPGVNTGQSVQEEDEDGEEDEDEEQRPGLGSAIESMSVSSVSGDVIWVGANNGLIKLSRDHGATWKDVSIPAIQSMPRAEISSVDASHQDAGTAYVSVDCHTSGDYKPYLYRTHDFGATWAPIVTGLPDDQIGGSFARVIRADTARRSLLFAGTESCVYFSADDGDHWQSLRINLPTTSYRDMSVTGSDLVVGTFGRGFWILDDVSPLRQITGSIESEPAHLFKPAAAIRVRRNVNGDTPFPPEVPHAANPPTGAIIYYYLGTHPAGDITLEIRDAQGKAVRRLSSASIPATTEAPPPIPDFWVQKPLPLPTAPGLNRAIWDLRFDSPPAFSHSYEINANPGETPPSPEGPLVIPGIYTMILTVDGKSYRQAITVNSDPRSPATVADLHKQYDLQISLYQCVRDAWNGYNKASAARSAIAAILKTSPPEEVASAARAIDAKLAAVCGSLGFGRQFGGGFPGGGGAARQPTFAALNGTAVRQLNKLDSGDMAPTEAMQKATAATCAEAQQLIASWTLLKSKDLISFNALLEKNSLKPIGSF